MLGSFSDRFSDGGDGITTEGASTGTIRLMEGTRQGRRRSSLVMTLWGAAVVGCLTLQVGCRPKQTGAKTSGTPAASAPAANGARPVAAPLAIRFTDQVTQVAPVAQLRRGINLGNGLDAPQEGAWGVVLSERHFEMAKAAGLDHVRLPVRFSAHAQSSAPFTVDEAFFERVDWAVEQALAGDLQIIVDLHHYEELFSEPEKHEARFLALWRQVAERYRDAPEQVLFELLNEPNSGLDPARWNRLLAQAVAVVRDTNPSRILIIDSYFWAAASYLKNLELPEDPNLVASFHMYQPILFTHQGAEWMGPEYQTLGVIFPGPPAVPLEPVASAEATSWVRDWIANYNRLPAERNPSGVSAVAREFDMAQRYVQASGRRVYLGEFGAIDKADEQSRENYLRLVRLEAERRGIAWALWDDGGRNKAMDVRSGEWVPVVRRALFEPGP